MSRRSEPVSSEAVGLVRRWRAQLGAAARDLTEAAEQLPASVIEDAAYKSGAGARRAWSRILQAMPEPPYVLNHRGHVALWRLLLPRDDMFDCGDGSTQPADSGVVVSYLLIGRSRGRAGCLMGPWGLASSNRVMARLLACTGLRADLAAVMLEAHDTLLAASAEIAPAVLARREWCLPAARGAFVATVRAVQLDPDDGTVLACAGTWVGEDQLHADQRAQMAALRSPHLGWALGDGLLLPAPLRPAAPPMVGADGGLISQFSL